MNSHSTINKPNSVFTETDATIYHDGKAYSAGGAWLLKRKDTGKLEGILYRHEDGMIGTWDSSIKVKAYYGTPFRTNFGQKGQYVWFTWEGHKMVGRNNSIEWQDIFRVREVKS